MKDYELLPEYPRTEHLPYRPNKTDDDLVADPKDLKKHAAHWITVQEKVDGSAAAFCLHDGHPIIRNRSNILRKGFKGRTAAKLQFDRIWNHFYENKAKFERLESLAGQVSVYGEWMVAQHGTLYDRLPDYFLAFDVYRPETRQFLDPIEAEELLSEAGFSTVPRLYDGKWLPFGELAKFLGKPSPFSSTEVAEGIYIKVRDGKSRITGYKMVREGFVPGKLWNPNIVQKNALA